MYIQRCLKFFYAISMTITPYEAFFCLKKYLIKIQKSLNKTNIATRIPIKHCRKHDATSISNELILTERARKARP